MHALARLAVIALVLAAPLGAHAQDEPPPTDESTDEPASEPESPPREPYAGTAEELAAAHPHVTSRSIGRTAGDRELRLITIGDANAEWAALVVTKAHGRRPADESRLALDVASWLAEHIGELPERTVFHVLADANPDASAAVWPRAGNDRPVDEDADGDVDEDGADDVDGDGAISWMRYPDPTGEWSFDDEDRPVRAEPAKGAARTHRIVAEGRDDDGDGAWNEDGPGGVDISRNFTWAFEEHVAAAGRWPASESETRAIMDLILAEQRIALVYEVGGAESVASTPGWSEAWQKLPDDDAGLLEGLRELHEDGAVEERRSHGPGHGSLGGAVWHQLGRIWMGRAPLDRVGAVWPDGDTVWPEHLMVSWTAADGEGLPEGAEIATIEPHDEVAPPPAVFAETPSIGAFLRDVAAARARVSFTDTVATGASGVLRLRTRLVNTGRLPTHTVRGAELRARRPLNVRVILPDGASLAGGRPLVQIERLAPGGASDELAWVVAGRAGDTVRIEVTGPDTGTVVHEERIP
jgi:hypothetical protein